MMDANSIGADRAGHPRLFRAIGTACGALAMILPVAVVGFWLLAPLETLATAAPLPAAVFDKLDLAGRAGAAVIGAIPLAVLVWALLRVRQTFIAFAAGRIFSSEAIAGLRDFAIGVGVSALAKPLVTMLLSLYLTWGQPQGQRQLVVMLGSDTLLFVLFAAIFLSATWIMRQAAAVAEENRQFI